jgi:hypothetical protein
MSKSRSHRYGEENNLLSLLRIEPRLLGCMQLSVLKVHSRSHVSSVAIRKVTPASS